MLKRLYISNFTLIDEMDVQFPGGLTVITGETGAGKSIFLEALSLALGKRAEGNMLLNNSRKCVIEAEFDISKAELGDFFAEEGLPEESTLLLRREISPDGRSRTFLNDGLVSLGALKKVSERLIDIHSQHQTLLLGKEGFQLRLLDAFAGTAELFVSYRSKYQQLAKINAELQELRDRESQSRKEEDYARFLHDELAQLQIKPGELAQLEEEAAELDNFELIRQNLLLCAQALSNGDTNVLTGMNQVKQSLQSIGRFGSNYREYLDRISSVYLEIKDLSGDIERAAEGVQMDESRLALLNSRLDAFNRLMKKHQVKTEEELLSIQGDLSVKLQGLSSMENQIKELQKQASRVEEQCRKLAGELSDKRKSAVRKLEHTILEILKDLSLENARFGVQLVHSNELTAGGFDTAAFLFSANKGGVMAELSKVASGGELSRLMLSLKSVLAERRNLPAIIFDEIDTGVSGEVADRIGKILKKMGDRMQVIVITHLPQMASKGSHHLFVYKNQDESRTLSNIRQLNKEERVTEIAKMLSTANPTQSALKNAKELLSMN